MVTSEMPHRCEKCGQSIYKTDRSCGNCGAPVEGQESLTASVECATTSKSLPIVEFNEGVRQALFILGVEYLRHGRYSEAVEALRKSLQEEGTTPPKPDIFFYLGSALKESGDRDQAFETYLQGIIDDPNRVDQVRPALSGLLCMELSEGNQEKAISFLRIIRDCNPFIAQEIMNSLLASGALPPASRADRGEARFTLAKLERAAGLCDKALEDVTQALNLGFNGDVSDRDVPARLLRAQLLEELKLSDQAAEEYYQAGRARASANKADEALEPLKKAVDLRPSLVDARWELSEAWRQASYTGSPSIACKRLTKARDAWEEAEKRDRPDVGTSWVYVSRALINERAVDLLREGERWRPELPWELKWQSIVFLERSILLASNEPHRWHHLSRFFNYWLTPTCAFDAGKRAVRLDPRNPNFLLEHAINAVNSGQYNYAENFFKEHSDLLDQTWSTALRAFLLTKRGQFREVPKMLSPFIEQFPELLWSISTRGYAYLQLHQDEEAEQDYRSIYKRYKRLQYGDQSSFVSAALWLGEYRKVIEWGESALSDPYENTLELYTAIGLAKLAIGQCNLAQDHLTASVKYAARLIDLRALLQNVKLFKKRLRGTTNPNIISILNHIAQAVLSRRWEVRAPLTSEKELAGTIEREVQNGRQEGYAWLGAQLGRARALMAEDRLEEAGLIYQSLLQDDQVPETRLGLKEVVRRLLSAGDQAIKLGVGPDLAIKRWQAADRLASSLPQSERPMADLHIRRAYSLHGGGDITGSAEKEFEAALACFRADPGGDLARTCRPLLAEVRDYWSLDDRWERMARTVGSDDPLAAVLSRARMELRGYLNEYFQMDQPSYGSLSYFFRSLAIEITKEVLPPEAGNDWWFVKDAMEAVRQRILEDTGVYVLGVQVRGNTQYPIKRGYVILINELPVAFGFIEKDKYFTRVRIDALEMLGISASEVMPFAPSDSGLLGFWVDASVAARLHEHRQHESGDPFEAAVAHFEAAVHRNLAEFFGIDEAKTFLDRWADVDPDNDMPAELRADSDKVLRFGKVLRALVEEGVTITDWQRLLAGFEKVGAANQDIDKTVALLRLRLKTKLPGQGPEYQYVNLPAHVEADIARYVVATPNGQVLAIPNDRYREILAEFRSILAGTSAKTVLVVDRGDLRSAVRKLVSPTFPQTVVLSKAEMDAT